MRADCTSLQAGSVRYSRALTTRAPSIGNGQSRAWLTTKTTFIGLHVGHSSEDLGAAAQALDRFPNFHVEIAARIGELGRQPRRSRWFFDKYQDRILFGTDGVDDELYPHYFRFLETEDEYFDYGPGPVPGQGRWRIYGIGLPDPVLRKVYSENAARLLSLSA